LAKVVVDDLPGAARRSVVVERVDVTNAVMHYNGIRGVVPLGR
jgi:hypothetical protein